MACCPSAGPQDASQLACFADSGRDCALIWYRLPDGCWKQQELIVAPELRSLLRPSCRSMIRRSSSPVGAVRHCCRTTVLHAVEPTISQLTLLSFTKKRQLVPLAGIEPALLAEHDFESRASTNSATGARRSKTSRRAGLYRRGAFGQWRSCASPRHRARTERAWSDPQPDRVHHSSVFGMVWESRLGYQGAPADRPQIVSCDKVPPSSPCVGGLVGGRYG